MRKERDFIVSTVGRDKGKTFLITEMSAVRAAKWADRAMLELARSGVDVPEDMRAMGPGQITTVLLKALGGVRSSEAEALFDEMLGCVKFKDSNGVTRGLIEEDIEEIGTVYLLRDAVLEIHTGFSIAAALSNFQSPPPGGGDPTPTS